MRTLAASLLALSTNPPAPFVELFNHWGRRTWRLGEASVFRSLISCLDLLFSYRHKHRVDRNWHPGLADR